MRLTEPEFWDLEPYQLTLLFDQWEAAEQRLDMRVAVLGCITGNAFRGKDSKPLEPADLFPSLKPDGVATEVLREKQPNISADQQLEAFKAILGDRIVLRP